MGTMETVDAAASEPAAVPLGRRAAAGILDVGMVAATCLVLLDVALNLGASGPVAWGLVAVGPTLLWGLLESRGPGALGRLATGLAVRNLDGSRLGVTQAVCRQAPLGMLVSASVLIAPGLALLALGAGLIDLAAGRGQPLHRTLRDRWSATVVVSKHTARASERMGFAYLESGAPMRYRGED